MYKIKGEETMDNNARDRERGVDTYAIVQKKKEMMAQLPQEQIDKYYGVCGIYGMWIDDKLVYIGQSKNMLWRWLGHKVNTFYDYGQHDYKEDKYRIMREAVAASHSITFGIIEECKAGYLWLNEHKWIDKLNPVLNMEFTNHNLHNLHLQDILD
jgi:hypothetical protein